jgi:hypothetical protein
MVTSSGPMSVCFGRLLVWHVPAADLVKCPHTSAPLHPFTEFCFSTAMCDSGMLDGDQALFPPAASDQACKLAQDRKCP